MKLISGGNVRLSKKPRYLLWASCVMLISGSVGIFVEIAIAQPGKADRNYGRQENAPAEAGSVEPIKSNCQGKNIRVIRNSTATAMVDLIVIPFPANVPIAQRSSWLKNASLPNMFVTEQKRGAFSVRCKFEQLEDASQYASRFTKGTCIDTVSAKPYDPLNGFAIKYRQGILWGASEDQSRIRDKSGKYYMANVLNGAFSDEEISNLTAIYRSSDDETFIQSFSVQNFDADHFEDLTHFMVQRTRQYPAFCEKEKHSDPSF